MSIFISIAAYRDPELVSTVQGCLAMADEPDDIRIGLVWQHTGDEEIDAIAGDPRVTVLDIPAEQSAGACWARAKAMTLYGGETYYMQLDSHHRFVQGWDTALKADMVKTGSEKPLLSSYLPAYHPDHPTPEWRRPSGIIFHRFEGPVALVRGGSVDPNAPEGRPIPAKFVAGGFIFTLGSFVSEVPYDPELYFHGEEISVALRAYSWGYDLFHPSASMIFHYYGRVELPRHWSDDKTRVERGPAWWERDKISKRRIRNLFSGVTKGRYGLGPVRTVADYERLTGLDFARGRERVEPEPEPTPRPRPVPAGGLRCG